uniref:DNA-directed RNA polymerase III subunit RPC5 n=1 Tax=Rhodosorus marinus TaxID=101924 RepID=A0A7S2ZJM5_9RHOD|mmetsp:Transcript_20767/g.84436  ORF Transcript_20767/g.84436 Transcript_20767/m.84436 type:complete len:462 (+) Transcript_20767:107-1492(+)
MLLEEEDEVVAEYDVRLVPSDGAVYDLQFPLRPRGLELGADRKILGGRARPRQRRLELNLELVSESAKGSFDHERLRSFGEYPQQRMVGAATASGHVANHVATMFNGRSLTLVPIDAMLQLRPDFSYVEDFQDSEAKKGEDMSNRVDTDPAEHPGEESGVEAIDVKFRRRETEKAEQRRKKSHAYLVRKREEEAWVDLEVLTIPHKECEDERSRLFDSVKTENERNVPCVPSSDYIRMLSPMSGVQPRNQGTSVMDSFLGPLSRAEIQALPLQSAVEEIIKRARIVSLNTVFEMLDRRYPVNDVFKSLESHAFTVRGNWIALNPSASGEQKENGLLRYAAIRSLILVDPCFRCRIVQSETVRAARDVILYMLRESTFLTTAQAKERTYDFLMDSLIEEILEEVCVKVKGTGWKLRLADDNEVIEKYSAALTKHRHEHEDRLHRADELLVEKSGTVKLSTGA